MSTSAKPTFIKVKDNYFNMNELVFVGTFDKQDCSFQYKNDVKVYKFANDSICNKVKRALDLHSNIIDAGRF